MRPVSARWARDIAQSHQIAIAIDILEAGQVIGTVTTETSGSVTLDATAAVRGRLDLTVADDGSGIMPRTASDPLAPYGRELRMRRGVAYPDADPELVSVGVFRLDSVDVDGKELRIAGQDRAARVIDGRFEEPFQIAAGVNYATAIITTIQQVYPDVQYQFIATTQTTPALNAEEGDDRWAFCQSMATALGCELYFDGDGVLILRPVAQAGNGVVAATLAEGEGGVLLGAARNWSREGTYNRVIAAGENVGSDTPPARGVATDLNPASPTYYFGPFGRVPRFYSSPFIATNDQAASAAQAILARELGTTQRVTFDTVVNPALEPGDVVRVTRQAAGIDEDHVIDSLTIPLDAAGQMGGTTRATQAVA